MRLERGAWHRVCEYIPEVKNQYKEAMATLYDWLADVAYRRIQPSTIAFIDDKDVPEFVLWPQAIAGQYLIDSVQKASRQHSSRNAAYCTQRQGAVCGAG